MPGYGSSVIRNYFLKGQKTLWMLPFVKFIPVDNSVAVKSVNLPQPLHSDPADRIIIATAISSGVPLVTRDEKILNYPHVQTIW